MHVRVVTTSRGERKYRYAQLVESYRRPSDGMPLHRVVAHLGALSDAEVQNLRTALAASRRGSQVVLPAAQPQARPTSASVIDNLEYLDVAVVLELWREWKLDVLLAELMSQVEQEVPPGEVVAALTVQRCVAPGSKLFAERWFPRTALPELLGISPDQFNNTRIHRVLDLLDQATPALQERLPLCYSAREGAFTAMFLDVTDTWFIGKGPETLAQKGKTKEGLYERKIGIVMMCNQAGLPLRWEVIPGRKSDSNAMHDMLHSAGKLDWIRKAPVVCDRAMGKTAHIRKLLASQIRFVTALTEDEFDSYTDRVPHTAVASIEPSAEDAAQQAADAVTRAGMSRVTETLYVRDLGVIERGDVSAAKQPEPELKTTPSDEDPLRRALEQASQMRTAMEQGRAVNHRDAAREHDLSKERAIKLMGLLKLAPELQSEIRAGKATGLSINAAIRVAKVADPQAQGEAFERERDRSRGKKRRGRKSRPVIDANEEPLRVRAIVCFNPEQFVEQRLAADKLVAKLHALARDLNGQLASPNSRRSRESAYAELDRELRRHSLVEAFEILIAERPHECGKPRLHVELQLRQNVWRRSRRYDGFTAVVGHPDLLQGAVELARLYRAKDMVEKDFHIIKSLVQLRPVRHRTDSKVRAHVTLCMLALLLERTLEHKLADSPAHRMSAPRVLEELHGVHLNRLVIDRGATVYTATQVNSDQSAILRTLGLGALADDQEITSRIAPR
jgi:hypothetical protein